MSSSIEVGTKACPPWCTDHMYDPLDRELPGLHCSKLVEDTDAFDVLVYRGVGEIDAQPAANVEASYGMDADECRRLAARLIGAAELLDAINAKTTA